MSSIILDVSNKNMNNKPPVVVLTGPTSVGKTELSVKLAAMIDGEIISADSMQVYKGMDIGTAKITKAQMRGIPHHLIDVLTPSSNFDVTVFCKMAKECLDGILSRGKVPIIVGGTGFYIQGLLYDIDFSEGDNDTKYRDELEKLWDTDDGMTVIKMLKDVDEQSANKLHPNDKRRIIRALEYYKTSGLTISEHNDESNNKISPYNFAYFVLNDYREDIYKRINQRVDEMMNQGLLDEVKSLLDKGYVKGTTALQGIGYKELCDYLDNITTLPEAVDKIKQNSRHYAKRQITWFKREKDVIWLNKYDYDYDDTFILSDIMKILTERKIINQI